MACRRGFLSVTGVSVGLVAFVLPSGTNAHGGSVRAISADAASISCAGPTLVSSLPLARRLAELEMVGVTFGEAGVPSYASQGAGGVFYLGQPGAGSGGSIASVNAAVNSAAAGAHVIPPFIATDEEGGGVARLSNVIGALPWERQQAQWWTPAQLEGVMVQHGAAMRSLGFNMNLAPVVDTAPVGDPIGYEGLRSYSENGPTTAAYGTAAFQGMLQSGIVPVLKHFPGLGHVNANTDISPGTDPPLSGLQGDDLIPFAQGVTTGAPVVMMSHAIVPGLTGGLPASVSPAAYSYLHQTLGFAGLSITDALGAGALSAAGYNEERAAVTAISSGADMVLVDESNFAAVLAALTQAVNSGALPVARVNDAVGRILTAKAPPVCYSSPATGTHTVHSAILGHYQAFGGPAGLLGYPTTDETGTPDHVGRYNNFANNGSIYWTPTTGARSVYGAIRNHWSALGGIALLGYPTTDETATSDGVGRFNHFANDGSIYWTPTTGARSIHGAIRDHWQAMGWERSVLGYPLTDETATPDGGGRYNNFANNGSIYWTPTTGAWSLNGAIGDRWAALGREHSPLGYPTSDEYAIPGGRQSSFQHGTISWNAATGATTVRVLR